MSPFGGAQRVKDEMERRGLRFCRRRGQNFLFNEDILEFICTAGEVSPGDLILEIGTGAGSLTWALTRRGAQIVTVEIDRAFMALGRDLVLEAENDLALKNVTWLEADFLRGKRLINPQVEAVLCEALGNRPDCKFKVISNLPYCIATPAIMNILDSGLPWDCMIVMIQEEVAARLLASPGTTAYGMVSVLARARADIHSLRRVRPGSFWPPPDVESRIVRLTPTGDPSLTTPQDFDEFRQVTRMIFAHKRKTWLKSMKLACAIPDGRTFQKTLNQKGIDATRRAEELSFSEIYEIAKLYAHHLAKNDKISGNGPSDGV